jgi:hypothetical protein
MLLGRRMPSARKRRPGRTKSRRWVGIIIITTITITIITGGIITTTTTIIAGGITTITTTITSAFPLMTARSKILG